MKSNYFLNKKRIEEGVDDGLDNAIPSNTADSVNDILLDQIKPRLPASGTISTLTTSAVNVEVDTALNTEIPSSNTADSVNDILLDKLEPRLPGSGTLSTLSTSNISDLLDLSLDTEIPSSNTANSVNDVLLDKIVPRLPASGTLSVLSAANINTQVDDALNTVIPGSNTANSVNDILLDKLTPRLPSSGTIAVGETYIPEVNGLGFSTTSIAQHNTVNLTSTAGLLSHISLAITTTLSGGSITLVLEIQVDGLTQYANHLWSSGTPQPQLRGAVQAHSISATENGFNAGNCYRLGPWNTRFTDSLRVSFDVQATNSVSGYIMSSVSYAKRASP